MKKVSDALKELGVDFSFPIEIKDADGNETYFEDSNDYRYMYKYDANGNVTYYEDSNGYWNKREYDANGKETYYEDRYGYWYKREYDANGKETYYENSYGRKQGTLRSQSCDGKVIEIDGKKYKLTEL